jgi:hypothetical protein
MLKMKNANLMSMVEAAFDLHDYPPKASPRWFASIDCALGMSGNRSLDIQKTLDRHEALPQPLRPSDGDRAAPLPHCAGSEFLGSFLEGYTRRRHFTKSKPGSS